jgi:hypothetical protein
VLLGTAAVAVGLELYWVGHGLVHDLGEFSRPMSALTVAVFLALYLCCCIVIGKLGRTTGFAAVIGAFLIVKTLPTLASVLDTGAERLPAWVYYARTLVAVACSAGLGALALHARGVITGGAHQPGGPLQPPVAVEASGGRLVATGAVLLLLGIGVTVASYEAASSGSGGGHYVVATGAIASGLVTLVRGLSRLGK